MDNGRITVLVADDDVYFHELLTLALEREGMLVVGVTSHGHEVVQMALASKPDVILLDMNMPGMDGLEVMHSLRTEGVQSHIIVVSGYPSYDLLVKSIRLGAVGYLSKQSNAGRIASAIRKVAEGQKVVDPGTRLARARDTDPAGDHALKSTFQAIGSLTDQEDRVLRLVAEGLTNEDIATHLAVSRNTIKTHLRNIYCKLGVSGRTQAAIWALRNRPAAQARGPR